MWITSKWLKTVDLQRSKRHSHHHNHQQQQQSYHQQNSKASTSHTENNNSSMSLPQTLMHTQHIIHPAQQTDQISQHIQSTQMLPQCMQPSSQILGSTFIDPSQYLTAIPVQPVMPSGFPSTAAVISSIQVWFSLFEPLHYSIWHCFYSAISSHCLNCYILELWWRQRNLTSKINCNANTKNCNNSSFNNKKNCVAYLNSCWWPDTAFCHRSSTSPCHLIRSAAPQVEHLSRTVTSRRPVWIRADINRPCKSRIAHRTSTINWIIAIWPSSKSTVRWISHHTMTKSFRTWICNRLPIRQIRSIRWTSIRRHRFTKIIIDPKCYTCSNNKRTTCKCFRQIHIYRSTYRIRSKCNAMPTAAAAGTCHRHRLHRLHQPMQMI